MRKQFSCVAMGSPDVSRCEKTSQGISKGPREELSSPAAAAPSFPLLLLLLAAARPLLRTLLLPDTLTDCRRNFCYHNGSAVAVPGGLNSSRGAVLVMACGA